MLFVEETGRPGQALTQGGSLYDITVGTVVNVDVHRMMLLHLHAAGDTARKKTQKHSRGYSLARSDLEQSDPCMLQEQVNRSATTYASWTLTSARADSGGDPGSK